MTKKKQLGNIIDNCIKKNGITVTAQMLDNIKATGFKYSTKSGISISVYDMTIPPEKYTKVAEAEQKVGIVTEHFQSGELSEEERYNNVIKIWEQTTDEVTNALSEGFDPFNSIKMMIDSGARGNASQLRQLAGMRGLMFATNGKTMEIPIKSNFREGLNNLEYFIGARGSRKSLSDTALRTADSGYLTRRLVDVSQQVIIREADCGTNEGIIVSDIRDGDEIIEPLKDRLIGRYALEDVVSPITGEIIIRRGDLISEAVRGGGRYVCLEHIQDPANVGALLRSAAALSRSAFVRFCAAGQNAASARIATERILLPEKKSMWARLSALLRRSLSESRARS